MAIKRLRGKSLFVENAQPSVWAVESKIVSCMALTLLNTNANSAALFLSGSVGVILTSVNPVIRSSVLVITFR